ncbi:MAG: hypothetical protein IJ634_06345 [Bacteroidales bacterium]|nr:hypothetical protein [Bacteroidales bacterium]
MTEKFEDKIHKDLYEYLLGIHEVDRRMPECTDVEERWVAIGNAYIPDGAREFRDYPVASLGWMMYIGMAVAKLWDDEWSIYSQIEDLYAYMRDKRGYNALDEYICEDVLMLRGKDIDDLGALVGECAARVHHTLMHERIEPGTKEAFEAYVACLRQLYLFGMAVQLRRMGYHMERVR